MANVTFQDTLEATVNGASSKTASQYAATDLVPLFNSSGELIGKISRTELMSAVQTSLGTLLNGGTAQTSITKVPSLNGNTLGAITPANLASVLGGAVTTISSNTDLNNITTFGRYVCGSGATTQTLSNCPVSVAFTLDVFPVPGGQYIYQTLYAASSPLQIWSRRKSQYGFDNWQRIDGMFTGVMPNNTDVKELGEGRYIKNANVTGATGYPSQVTGSFIVEVVRDSLDNTSSHIWLYDIALPGAVYFNVKWNGTWRGWQRIDNYGTSTAAELATLLGVFPILNNNGTVTDLNAQSNPSGWYKLNVAHNVANVPTNFTDGFIWIMRTSETTIFQMALKYDFSMFQIRLKWGQNWTDWKSISLS